MTWQQLLVATWLIVEFVVGAYGLVTDRRHSSGGVTLGLALQVAIQVSIALVLHSGGFW